MTRIDLIDRVEFEVSSTVTTTMESIATGAESQSVAAVL
jgi:hypothetical protein